MTSTTDGDDFDLSSVAVDYPHADSRAPIDSYPT